MGFVVVILLDLVYYSLFSFILCRCVFTISTGVSAVVQSYQAVEWWTRGALIFSHCHYHAIYHTFRDYSFRVTDSRWFDDDTGCPQDNGQSNEKENHLL